MPSVAQIVHEELAAALATAEARIAERIAALLGGGVGKASRGRAPPFMGRVRARMAPADVEAGRRAVLAAVKGGATTAGAIQAATGLDRHRVTYIVNDLRDAKKLRRRGKGRRATYAVA